MIDINKLKEEIQRLERDLFIHEMKDHWDSADFSYAAELHSEINKRKELLNGTGKEIRDEN